MLFWVWVKRKFVIKSQITQQAGFFMINNNATKTKSENKIHVHVYTCMSMLLFNCINYKCNRKEEKCRPRIKPGTSHIIGNSANWIFFNILLITSEIDLTVSMSLCNCLENDQKFFVIYCFDLLATFFALSTSWIFQRGMGAATTPNIPTPFESSNVSIYICIIKLLYTFDINITLTF